MDCRMKKLSIILAALMLPLLCNAQISIGAKGGAAASWIPHTMLLGNETAIVPHLGGYAGGIFQYDLNSDFMLQAELLFAQKGHSDRTQYDYFTNKYDLNLGYLQIPVFAGMHLGDEGTVMIGPEFGCLLYAKSVEAVDGSLRLDAMDRCRKFNAALAIQINHMFSDSFGVDVKYSFALTKTFDKYMYRGMPIEDKGHNSTVQIGLCYRFELY